MTNYRIKPKSPQNWRQRQVRQTPLRGHKPATRIIKKSIKQQWKKGWWQKLITAGVMLFLIIIVVGFIAVAWISRDLPEPGGVVERDIPVSTKIYDRTGEVVLFEFFSDEKRTPIKLIDLPNHVKWAAITAEDRNFYSHAGFKFTSIIRSLIVNILRGKKVQGGSTITQQFIKNALLTPEKKITRKVKELILAWQLESKFSKDEILELYFNEIPYGSVAYGIESAAQTFFDKKAKNLSIAEAALLAALPKAPTYYSPYGSHKDELIGRQQFIIKAMYEEGYITKNDSEAALAENLIFSEFRNTSIIAPHFVFYIKDLLTQKYGEYTVERGGLKVITSLDLFKQDVAQKIIDERGEINAKNFNANNAAFIALDPKTGEILSMIGSRDFFNENIDGEVNVTLRARQPGSSFKPFVYATAFAAGFSPETVLYDLETTFKTEIDEDYEPKNYNLDQNGPVNIRQALGSSLNIPAVKIIYLTGVDKVLDLADKLGYSTLQDRSRFGLSLVLGGAEVKLLEHVAAYAALARDGEYRKPVGILKIEDKKGRILEEFKPEKIKPIQAIDPQIVRQINSILTDNEARLLTFQPNNYLYFPDRPVAAKTGTTNDFRDAWTLGYTPSLVAGVWVGNNDNSVMKGKAAGGTLAAPIWREFMQIILGDTPVEEFKAPDSIQLPNKPMFNGNKAFENRVKIDKTTGLLATDFTPKNNIVEQVYSEVHNILHYTNRHNLLGPIPEAPWDDPNYTSWEIPVEEWAQEQGFVTGTIPSGFDNLHKAEDQPTITLISPLSTTFTNPAFNVTVSATAPRGISYIEYYFDNSLIDTETANSEKNISNYVNNITLPNQFVNGQHLLKVIVYDDLGNDSEAITNINLQLPNNPNRDDFVEFIKPGSASKISSSSFPYEINIIINNADELKKIDFYWLSKADNSSTLITSISEIAEEIKLVIQDPPTKGKYSLYTITTDTNSQIKLDKSVEIEIK